MMSNAAPDNIPNLRLTDFSFSRFYGLKFPVIVTKEVFSKRVQVPHLHDFVHIWYCIDGSYTHTVGDCSFKCGKGSVVIVPPGTTHGIFPDEGTDITMLSVDIAYNAFLGVRAEVYPSTLSHMLLPSLAGNEIPDISYFYQLSEQSQTKASKLLSELTMIIPLCDASTDKILDLLETFFSLSEFNLCESDQKQAVGILNSRVFPILDSVHYLNENSSQKLYTKDLMKISVLCQTNFCMFFKKLMGMSASIYLQRLRVAKAMFFLAHTNYSIHYISDYCGFNSPSHMIYCFKKHAHAVPKESRNLFVKFLNDFPERSHRVSLE